MSKRNFPFNVNIDSYMDLNDSSPPAFSDFSPYRFSEEQEEEEEEEIKDPLTKKIKAVNNQKSN